MSLSQALNQFAQNLGRYRGTFLWHGFAMSRDVVVTNVGFDCAAKKK